MSAPLLFVSGEYPPDVGGVGDYTQCLRAALTHQGWPSRVLTRRDVGRWDARSLLRLLAAAPSHGIVHIQYQPAAFDLLGDVCLMPALLRVARPGVRVVTTFHDTRVPYLFPKAGRLRPLAVRLLARTSHAVIAADANDLAVLREHAAQSSQIPIGSNVACAPPPGYDRQTFRAALGAQPETLVVAYFGLLNASKGLDLLLDTYQHLARLVPDARLLVLGGATGASDPTDRHTASRLQARLTARPAPSPHLHGGPSQRPLDLGGPSAPEPLGLGGGDSIATRVIQPGWLEPAALSAYLLAADVALLPYADGASARRGSLLACAAHGLPIVSTTPATAEVAAAVEAVAPEPVALAQAILALHEKNDPAHAAARRRAAQTLAAQTAWPQIAATHAAIYEALLSP